MQKPTVARISSAQNPRLKLAAKLRTRHGREQQRRILIDGQRAIGCAAQAGWSFDELFLSDGQLSQLDTAHQALVAACATLGARIVALPSDLLARIGYGHRHDQWVATALPRTVDLTTLELPECPLVAIVEGLEKPGNLGAILRSADGAGVDALIVADAVTDLFNPNAIRASQGTIFTLRICIASSESLVSWIRSRQLTAYVARVDGPFEHTACDFRRPSAIVLGNESQGVSAEWRSEQWIGVRLPMLGQADSLNVSTAAAVIFYEALRQRRASTD